MTFRPCPKPEPRKKSQGLTDPANFDPDEIEAIYGERPRCVFTSLWQFCDPHHVLGRGYDLGVPPGHPDRWIFGSPLNFAPLQRDVHKGSARDEPEIRRFLLRKAREKVMEAVREDRYELTDRDRLFLARADAWLAEHPC